MGANASSGEGTAPAAEATTAGTEAAAAATEAPATREIKPEEAAAPEKPAAAEEAAAPQEPAAEASEKPAEKADAPAPATGAAAESTPEDADAGERDKEAAATAEEASAPKKEKGKRAKAEKKAKAKAEAGAKPETSGDSGKGSGDAAKAKAAAKSKRQKTPPGVRVCVRNLQKDVTVEKLRELFAPYGNVLSAMVKTDGQGKSQGYGFINLPTQEEATKAINEMNGKMHEGKSLLVSPATERKDAKEAQATPEGGKAEKGAKGKSKGTPQVAQASAVAPMAGSMSPTGMSWPMGYPYPYPAQYGQYGQYGMNPYMGMPYYNPYPLLPYPQQPGAMPMSANATPFVPSGGAVHDGAGAKEYKGTLKKVSERNGFGFILCDELRALYDRDVYVDSELLPKGVEAGSPLRFTFTLSDKKHPRAERVVLDTPSS